MINFNVAEVIIMGGPICKNCKTSDEYIYLVNLDEIVCHICDRSISGKDNIKWHQEVTATIDDALLKAGFNNF